MRVIFAGLFVFGGLTLVVGLLSTIKFFEHSNGLSIILLVLITVPVFFVLLLLAIFLFSPRPKFPKGTLEQQIADLAEKGLLVSTHFLAVRAFQVEEYEDEGSHYFLQLTDGSVLYLNDQYLYDYEPIDDDGENNQPRRFPCSDFTVQRHRDEGYVVQIVCGDMLEPEFLARAFTPEDWKQGRGTKDGQIITDRTYEELTAQFAN